ncbi:hypothetical protein DL98DRAFT_585125 [Cadophora sp. DSE1049]|nr:hypothetical protein DL98DRAFT_585125 [Cadophora sp. DSE1049]
MSTVSLVVNQNIPLIPSDLVDAFVTFIGPEILSDPIESNPATLHALKDTAKAVGIACMRSLKYANNPAMSLESAVTVTNKQWKDVKLLLVTLCRFARDGTATVEMIQEYQIIGILAMFSNLTNGLPFPIPEVAKRLKEVLQLVKEGKPAVAMDRGTLTMGITFKYESDVSIIKKEESDDDSVKSGPDSDDEIPITYADDEAMPITVEDIMAVDNKQEKVPWRRAPSDHPIFGIDGIMHHILLRRDKSKSYKIDPEYTSASGAVIGHNGFEVGAWFPRQLAMVRDGMHNLTVGGISGSLAVGAYSVVLSNPSATSPNSSTSPISHPASSSNPQTAKYPATDIDLGTVIYYSSTVKPLYSRPRSTISSANTSTSNNPNTNKGSLILAKSIVTGNPIRVIRKWTCDFEDRPSVGYRYEGLYKAVGMEERTVRFGKDGGHAVEKSEGKRYGEEGSGQEKSKVENDGEDKKGERNEEGESGYFWTVFKLERCSGQKDVDTSRPTEDETTEFAKVEWGF